MILSTTFQVGPAVQFSGSMNEPRLPPPCLGEHTNEVLAEILNLKATELEKLSQEGVIKQS